MASNGVVDFADVQGLVQFGYGKLTDACYYLLEIADPVAASNWLRAASVATAVRQSDAPDTALQVTFSASGLSALGVPKAVIAAFSPEFLSGMADDVSRSRRLGDVGASAPSYWRWGAGNQVPHLVVMLFAKPGGLAALINTIEDNEWQNAFRVSGRLFTSNLCGKEPFGFVDGVSQPAVDWERTRPQTPGDQLSYGNLVSIGEFLLGYPNEYGKLTERPLVSRGSIATDLPPAMDDSSLADVGRNGTYVVFRQLKQDVGVFWRYLLEQAAGDAAECTRLAEAMVGRRIDGEALIHAEQLKIAGIEDDDMRNKFRYASDPEGLLCPLGAHIRRTNPRNADVDANGWLQHLLRTLGFCTRGVRDDIVASTRFHRILRRGREYGPPLSPEDAMGGKGAGGEQGLHFICLNANIGRQFEFVQNAWVMSAKFDAIGDESDPLLGNREPLSGGRKTDSFTMATASGIRRRLVQVPQFVTVVGGAYLFMPGIRALRYFADCGGAERYA